MLNHLHDPLLTVEVHWFHVVTNELDCMEEVLVANEDQWGHLATAKLGAIQRLEMADMLTRIKGQDDGLVDDALCIAMEVQLQGCSNLKRGWCYILVLHLRRHLPNGYDYMGKQYLVMDLLSVSTRITCTIQWLDPGIAVLGFGICEVL